MAWVQIFPVLNYSTILMYSQVLINLINATDEGNIVMVDSSLYIHVVWWYT